jgi:hypothetical protein
MADTRASDALEDAVCASDDSTAMIIATLIRQSIFMTFG